MGLLHTWTCTSKLTMKTGKERNFMAKEMIN
jgi:hypothetical protein